jgi:hypothetical protein
MTMETTVSVEERLRKLLRHLGADQAHFAGRLPRDWVGLATKYPEVVSSLTLIGGFDPHAVEHLASRLLVITGEYGPSAEAARNAAPRLPGAQLLTLRDYDLQGWSDVAAERAGELGNKLLEFLGRVSAPPSIAPGQQEGEAAGISYRIHGAGPPLVLLPMFLAPSQWEPLLARLSEQYCTITAGGALLGAVAILEARGHAVGYLQMVRAVIEEAHLRPGEEILEVGCGTGVLCRWLARRTAENHRIVGIDINGYLLREAMALARREGLETGLEFREGDAESLPFADNSFDVTMSVTVIEEADADGMLAEMVRVTKPEGRVAVIARAMDMPFLMNAPLTAALRAKVEAPGAVGGVGPHGCADASLYRRLRQTGLTRVRMLPQLAAFGPADEVMLQFMQDQLLPKLSQQEAGQWHAARAQAEKEGTFFMAFPHHCAVGTKPS